MSESIGFFYDPRCPWAWRTSKWVRELERSEIVSIDWRFFSLSVINEKTEDVLDDVDDPGAAGLRTLALMKETAGNQRSGDLYKAMGERTHEVPRRLTNTLLREAVRDCGFEAELVDQAVSDANTKQAVLQDHRTAVEQVGAFGVPTIVLESGRGIFGPVVDDEGAVDAHELWTHVRWLIDHPGFYELKRERD
jgi:predicted DsbA family dithiol-disulfide isomerase